MPATVHVQLQLRIVGDDGTVLTDNEILHFRKSQISLGNRQPRQSDLVLRKLENAQQDLTAIAALVRQDVAPYGQL